MEKEKLNFNIFLIIIVNQVIIHWNKYESYIEINLIPLIFFFKKTGEFRSGESMN